MSGGSAARIVVEFDRSKMMSSSSLSSSEKREAEKDGDAVDRVRERSRYGERDRRGDEEEMGERENRDI